jgi:hypothetical protein
MRIAIISDSHDNIVNIEKALKWINKEGIKTIIHCGDFCSPSTVFKVFMQNFSGEFHSVHGNVGDPEATEAKAKEYKNVHIYNWHYSSSKKAIIKEPKKINNKTDWSYINSMMGCGEIIIDNIKIAFTHSPNQGKELAQSGNYDYVFYGHTHRPWIEELKTNNEKLITMMANPGTLAGMFYKATFAVLDTETNKLELKILERI